MIAVATRCEICGDLKFEPDERHRRLEHLARLLPAEHHRAVEAATAAMYKASARLNEYEDSWLAVTPLGPLVAWVLRRRKTRLSQVLAKLHEVEAAALSKSPVPPPVSSCPCGGTRQPGAPIRCPACRSKHWTKDPTVAVTMAD